jgi:hypothetical protein
MATGHIFVTSVLLGGQQKTSKYARAVDRKEAETEKDALRGAIAARINNPHSVAGDVSSLAMSSNGGDSTIGSE